MTNLSLIATTRRGVAHLGYSITPTFCCEAADGKIRVAAVSMNAFMLFMMHPIFVEGAATSVRRQRPTRVWTYTCYLSPKYPSMKRTMTTAPTSQMRLFMACSLSPTVQRRRGSIDRSYPAPIAQAALPLPCECSCSVPASAAVPTATAQQKNDKNDDEKRGGIHVRLLWPLSASPLRSARAMSANAS